MCAPYQTKPLVDPSITLKNMALFMFQWNTSTVKKNIIHIHHNNLVSVSGFWDLLFCDNYSLLFAFFWFVTQYAVWWRSPAVCLDLRCFVLCPWFDLQCQSMRSQMSGCWIVAAATTRRMTTWTQKFSSLSNVYIHPIKIRQDLL